MFRFTPMKTGKARGSMRRSVLALAFLIVLLVSTVGYGLAEEDALTPVIDLAQNQQDVVIRGDRAKAYLSEMAGAGDFNGDGILDLLVGAAGHANFHGAAFVILGKPNLPASINLKSSPADLKILGASGGDLFGHSVAACDVNKDGKDDMVIGADGYSANAQNGAVYVFRGTATISGIIDLDNPNPAPMLRVTGAAAGDRLGRAVACADLNKDGYGDIIMSSYTASPGGRTQAGSVYVLFGGATLPTTLTVPSNQVGLTIHGAGGGAPTAISGDGAMQSPGAPFFDEQAAGPSAGIGDRLGRSMAIGDVNKDGAADLIVGAYGADANGKADAGKTYVFFGKASYANASPVTIDLSANPGGADITLNGVDAGDQAGFYVTSGDVNKDGAKDILVGAYKSQGFNNSGTETGEVYAVFGGKTGTINLSNADVTVYGAASGDRLGRSLTSADVNGDQYEDMILGASRADPNGRNNAGKTYVIYGKGGLSKTIQLSAQGSANIQILGAAGSNDTCEDPDASLSVDCPDEAGHSLNVGDLNGDGSKDIIIGAFGANNGSDLDSGAVYIVFSFRKQLLLPLVLKH